MQASAAPAVPTQPARTTPEIQYLALVEGVPGIDTSAGDEALVQAGYKTCSWLLYGYPRNNVEGRVMLELGVNANTSTVVVHAATTYICPDQKQE
ncbi:DUF732 domain-containing protein [Pseudonocardia sp. RS010]|uniref:DUF732 domain-containing protein n=1 Tax=Pseudonocardia sp. RS010 TaxID=3385979 RepID=UPI0039A02EF0